MTMGISTMGCSPRMSTGLATPVDDDGSKELGASSSSLWLQTLTSKHYITYQKPATADSHLLSEKRGKYGGWYERGGHVSILKVSLFFWKYPERGEAEI